MQILKPRRLQRGDCIGIATPASPIADPTRIERGVRYLETLGYRVVVPKNLNRSRGYLAGTDEERVADLHDLFSNKDVRAIFCVRGGYGTPRILSLVDYRLIARNPKIFVGYSDITALQLALWRRCRLVTFQGPMLGVDLAVDVDRFAEEWLWKLLTSGTPAGNLLPETEPTVSVHPGRAHGRLLGGNLALMLSIFGTRYQPDFKNSLLFIEDTDEEPYRIDRMFTQLRHASLLAKSAALLLGQFTDSDPKDPTKPSLTLAEVLGDIASWSTAPILSNLPFGHIPRKLTLPQGIHARVDTHARTLVITEGAVR